MKKKAMVISPADDAPLSPTALGLADKAGDGDELATCVAGFTTKYNNLDSEITQQIDSLQTFQTRSVSSLTARL